MNLGEALKKVKFTQSHQVLFGIMLNVDPQTRKPGPRLTMSEVHARYDAKTKKRHKEGSITTLMSQLRGEFEDATGIKYPPQWDIARGTGGGRTSNRASAVDVLSEVLGSDFDVDELDITAEAIPQEETTSV